MQTAPIAVTGATLEGGEWAWTDAGCDAAFLRSLGNVTIDVSVRGKAAAAGLSFGAYKDLLVPLNGERFLQVDIDCVARQWTFRSDGRIVARQWWNAKIASVDDLLFEPLLFKAHHPRRVEFRDLRVRQLESSCRLSVVLTCHRFARRLRVSLRNWCHQTLPSGALEVVVVNPGSPDDTHDVVFAATRAYPYVRVRELSTQAAAFRNKGRLINEGMAASRGEWIWLSDADCLFPPHAAAEALARVGSPTTLWYCERRHLTEAATNALIAGHIDAATQFQSLAAQTGRQPDVVPWGYCQIFHRSLVDRIRYREDVEAFSDSDITFVERCTASGVVPMRLDGLACLHLVHPWAWIGTNQLL